MAQRIVYGRRTVIFDGAPYIIEMRTSGIWIRRKHYREKIRVSFETLLKYTKPQFELGLEFDELDKGQQAATVSAVPKGQLVSGEPQCGLNPVHEGDEPATQADEGRVTGLDPHDGPEQTKSGSAEPGTTNRPTNDQLSSVD